MDFWHYDTMATWVCRVIKHTPWITFSLFYIPTQVLWFALKCCKYKNIMVKRNVSTSKLLKLKILHQSLISMWNEFLARWRGNCREVAIFLAVVLTCCFMTDKHLWLVCKYIQDMFILRLEIDLISFLNTKGSKHQICTT